MSADSLAESFLCSELEAPPLAEFMTWFAARRDAHRFSVRRLPFVELRQWSFDTPDGSLAHESGKFFSVRGLRVRTNHGPVREWDQPIINQPEIGILGIVTRVTDGVRRFLMQAKMEPGNVNTLQLSPTVQATRSNYTRVHGGRRPAYLDYFTDRASSTILVDQLQPEQGARFLRKRNRNMIIEVKGELPGHEDFHWLTLGQIRRLLAMDNIVNMDARTVLACASVRAKAASLPQGDPAAVQVAGHSIEGFAKDVLLSLSRGEPGVHSMDGLLSWLSEMKARAQMSVETVALDDLRGWRKDAEEIRHDSGRHFSVVAVSVEAGSREVVSWTQPLLRHFSIGLTGFLAAKIDGVLHFLARASVEPGNFDVADVGPTVALSGADDGSWPDPRPPFLDRFLEAPPSSVRYSAIQSEEGGRFFHFQNRYMLVELPGSENLRVPDDFIWMTLAQLHELTRFGMVNIEARNLLACLALI
jgi:dTDP-4-dehydro-6-deoxy-alpha-D-glucopyranose 2,3-dehydratase